MHGCPDHRRTTGILLFALLLSAYAYFHQFEGFNQNARLDLLHAIVSGHTLTIDAYHGNTGDKAFYESHYYNSKAPGTVVLALPAFVLAAGGLHLAGIPLDSESGWNISDWVATLGSVGVLTALGGVALFSLLTAWVDRRTALLTTLALYLGSLPFPYATMLFSHAETIGLLTIALWAALAPDRTARMSWQRHLIAGLALGFAVAGEYTAGIAVAGIVVLIAKRSGVLRSGQTAGWMIPPVLLLPLYGWLCFGSPLALGYDHEAVFDMHQGFFGIVLDPLMHRHALYLLFSPARGLVFWSPVLALVVIGVPALRSRLSITETATVLLVPLLHVFMIANYRYFDGGYALSARHLAPILPFLALPLAFGIRKMPRTGEVLTAVSIGLMTLGTSVGAMIPSWISEPVTMFYLPKAQRGEFVPNLASLTGAQGMPSLLPFALVAGFLLLSLLARTRTEQSPSAVPVLTWRHLEAFAIDTTYVLIAAFLFFAVRPGLAGNGGLHGAAAITPVTSPLVTVIILLFTITIAWYVVQIVSLLPALRQVSVHGVRRIGYTLQRLWTRSHSETRISSTESADRQMTLSI